MSDFTKNIIVILLTAVIGNGITMTKIGADINNLVKSVDKLEGKITTVDDRVRAIEIEQAKLNTLLSPHSIQLAAN